MLHEHKAVVRVALLSILMTPTTAFQIFTHRGRARDLRTLDSATPEMAPCVFCSRNKKPCSRFEQSSPISRSPSGFSQHKTTLDLSQASNWELVADDGVPRTMDAAYRVFFLGDNPSPRIVILILCLLAIFRCGGAKAILGRALTPFGIGDLAVAAASAVFWIFQEWWLHKYLLHSVFPWYGRTYHEAHHNKKFYHVSIDPLWFVVAWFSASAIVYAMLLPLHLALTGLITYTVMGLYYEFVHYIAHTRAVPKSDLLRSIKRHHMKHHLLDDRYWQAFTVIAVDSLLGTAPRRDELVRMRQHARATAAAAAAAGAKVSAGGGDV